MVTLVESVQRDRMFGKDDLCWSLQRNRMVRSRVRLYREHSPLEEVSL